MTASSTRMATERRLRDYAKIQEVCSESFPSIGRLSALLGVETAFLRARMAEDAQLRKAIRKGHALAQNKIARKQMELALKGQPQLLIHLGKHLLAQTDKQLTGVLDDDAQREARSLGELLRLAESCTSSAEAMSDHFGETMRVEDGSEEL